MEAFVRFDPIENIGWIIEIIHNWRPACFVGELILRVDFKQDVSPGLNCTDDVVDKKWLIRFWNVAKYHDRSIELLRRSEERRVGKECRSGGGRSTVEKENNRVGVE